jgi:branched-chain amino acid transport system substrate-binding protein
VNLRGGLEGHPVKLLVGDDGGDSTKSMTIVRDFVERQGAIALVDYVGAATVTISSYAEQKHVPVVGGLPDESWFKSWAMFPTQPPQVNYGYASAKVSADTGVKKVAALYCSESSLCHDSEKAFVDNARKVGLDVVYEGAISIAQPDFTAECLQAKGNGGELILPVADGNSITRIAQSCSRQSYHPIYLNLSPTTEQAAQPDLDGMIAVLRDFPWFLTSGAPALDEYNNVVSKYGGGHTLQFQSAIGWSAAKLFERAATHLSDKPSSQDVFTGLWALRNETLGGLVAAMQFQEMKPPVPANCAFVAKVAGGKWTAPNGLRMTGCRPT